MLCRSTLLYLGNHVAEPSYKYLFYPEIPLEEKPKMKNQVLFGILASICFTQTCATSFVPENILAQAQQNNVIQTHNTLIRRNEPGEDNGEEQMNQELLELEEDVAKYIELGEDKWVAFLARASPSHFEKIVKKIKYLLGKGDCEDEENEEEDNGDNSKNSADNSEEDDCEKKEFSEEEEDEDCDFEEDENDQEEERQEAEDGGHQIDWEVFAATAADKTKPLSEFLFGLQSYAEKQDPKKILKKAGTFDIHEFDSSSGNENASLTEKVNAGDVKDRQTKKWLASTAARRAKLITDAASNVTFNESAAFEAEDFQYRKGNIFLDDDDNDDFSNGCSSSYKESISFQVISVTMIAIFTLI